MNNSPGMSGPVGVPSSSSKMNKKRSRSDSPIPFLRRTSTLQSSASSSSLSDDPVVVAPIDVDADDFETIIVKRATDMASRASNGLPLTDDEVQDILQSIQNVCHNHAVNWSNLESFLRQTAHLSHKQWDVTDVNSDRLYQLLFGEDDNDDDDTKQNNFQKLAPMMLERIMRDGNWVNAVEYSQNRCSSSSSSSKPWAVLVTGVNGIRKTTSMYQPWFSKVLQEALIVPPGTDKEEEEKVKTTMMIDDLPTGTNSFFRQLDHMIATLCNRDFEILYQLTARQLEQVTGGTITPDVVQRYTNLKAAIFTRYRTLSELLGALLLKRAKKQSLNCLMETSGKDIAMFQYVDHFLPDYRKLALRFQINALDLAKTSVDDRMKQEIENGIVARTTQQIIDSNQGGPYGSEVLDAIQRESDAVWHNDVMRNNGVKEDWFKATIQITAHPDKAWTAQAIRPDGTLGTLYEFQKIEESSS